MSKDKMKRFEVNKLVRRALVKNGADLTQLQYSYVGRTLTFSGRLIKDDGRDFSATALETMLQDFYKIGVQVHSDLENWHISDGSISKKGEKKKKKNEDALHGRATKEEMNR